MTAYARSSVGPGATKIGSIVFLTKRNAMR